MVGRLLSFFGKANFQVRTVSFREGISGYNPYLLTGFFSFLAVTATEELVSGVRPFGGRCGEWCGRCTWHQVSLVYTEFSGWIFVFDLKQGSFWLQICGKTLLRNFLRNIVHGFCSDPSPWDAKRLVNGKRYKKVFKSWKTPWKKLKRWWNCSRDALGSLPGHGNWKHRTRNSPSSCFVGTLIQDWNIW